MICVEVLRSFRSKIAGKFELGLGIPHRQDLKGCPCLNRCEVVELAGGSRHVRLASTTMSGDLWLPCKHWNRCNCAQQNLESLHIHVQSKLK